MKTMIFTTQVKRKKPRICCSFISLKYQKQTVFPLKSVTFHKFQTFFQSSNCCSQNLWLIWVLIFNDIGHPDRQLKSFSTYRVMHYLAKSESEIHIPSSMRHYVSHVITKEDVFKQPYMFKTISVKKNISITIAVQCFS